MLYIFNQGGFSKHGWRTFGILCTGNLAFRLQYLFAIINKISMGFHIFGNSSGLSVEVVTIGWCALKARDDMRTITKNFPQ